MIGGQRSKTRRDGKLANSRFCLFLIEIRYFIIELQHGANREESYMDFSFTDEQELLKESIA